MDASPGDGSDERTECTIEAWRMMHRMACDEAWSKLRQTMREIDGKLIMMSVRVALTIHEQRVEDVNDAE